MTESASNLTGVWIGRYTYPYALPPVDFTATMIDSGASLTGATHEVAHVGGQRTAMLAGAREGQSIGFVKTYDGPKSEINLPINYEGLLSGDATRISGRWTIPGHLSGGFVMIREMRKAKARKRKVEAQI